jgi:hypothetical protein
MCPIKCWFVDKQQLLNFFSIFLIGQNAMYKVKTISKDVDYQYKYGILL